MYLPTLILTTIFAFSPSLAEIDKGDAANININFFHGPGCTGTSTNHPMILYDNSYTFENVILSYSLSRDLQPAEQLDFSTYSETLNSDACSLYVGNAQMDMGGAYNDSLCINNSKGGFSCARLWHH